MFTILWLLAGCGANDPTPADARPPEPADPTVTPSDPTVTDPTVTPTEPTPTEPTTPTDTGDTGDTGAEPGTIAEHTVPGHVGDPSDLLYDDTVIHTVDVALPQTSVDALFADPYTYTPGDVTVDGVTLREVGVRLRGKLGSFRDLNGKPKFKFDLNEYVAGQGLLGLDTLQVNNSVQDCSFIREAIGLRVYAAAGVAVPRVAYARVSVNGADYGLYQLVEVEDDEWLEKHFDDPSGNLYDGKYLFGDYVFQLLDFWPDLYGSMQLEEGTDVGHADVAAIVAALDAHQGQPDFYAALEPYVDWEQFHGHFAAEQYLDHWDGYALNSNNYRFYLDPARGGRVVFVPTDLDQVFPLYDPWWDWRWPYGRLVSACFADTACRDAHRVAVDAFLSNLDTAGLQAEVDRLEALIDADVTSDPRRECDLTSGASDRAQIRGWLGSRSDAMRAAWGL